MKIKKDNRNKFWAELELIIQKEATKKDKTFKLSGKWKRFVRKQQGFKIYAVNGEYVRNNLNVIFGHGGHGYVHEFIPLNEIWVGTRHFDNCTCKKRDTLQLFSKNYFESTIIHEIAEFEEMKKGITYWKAHQFALQKERQLGLLKNPYYDK